MYNVMQARRASNVQKARGGRGNSGCKLSNICTISLSLCRSPFEYGLKSFEKHMAKTGAGTWSIYLCTYSNIWLIISR